MPNVRYLSKSWMLWLLWTLASTLGFAIGIGLSMAAVGVVGEVVSSIAFGGTVGFAQWLVLRKNFQGSGWWILAVALGAPLGFAAANGIHRALLGVNIYLVASGLGMAALGLVIGIAQWWVLRRHLQRAGWWVLVSVAGWSAGGMVAWALRLKIFEFLKIMADFAILGIIVGASTGLVFIFLKKMPVQLEHQKASPLINLAITGCSLILIIMAGFREQTVRVPDELGPIPEINSVPKCSDLPPRDCIEDDPFCSEVVFFEPTTGPGYINYPINDETGDDQYRSYLRRDLRMLVQYTAARVACETEGWDYWHFESLGLGDMSEADGAIPGTSTGHPDHPPGTHQDGNDIDIAYFQKDSRSIWMTLEKRLQGLEGNLLRSMCKYTRFGMDVYHCTEPPRFLDPWRTALFIAYLAESPYTRVIGVDGQIGPVVDEALDQLAQSGWIEHDLREQIPLAYEETNEGMGWFRFHHHHLHISMFLR